MHACLFDMLHDSADDNLLAIGHGIATRISVIGWVNSCKKFDECYILPDAEKTKMRTMVRPAYKKWVTEDFGLDGKQVDALWGEVDRIAAELEKSWEASYLD